MEQTMLTPVLALITWTLIIWAWMYATRIPAMKAANIDPQDASHPGSLGALPESVRQIADNYNHLHEQPTVFYALVFYTAMAGTGTATMVSLAWLYVGLRMVHSLVQCTVNKVMVRFSVFVLSALVLVAMAALNLQAL